MADYPSETEDESRPEIDLALSIDEARPLALDPPCSFEDESSNEPPTDEDAFTDIDEEFS